MTDQEKIDKLASALDAFIDGEPQAIGDGKILAALMAFMASPVGQALIKMLLGFLPTKTV